MEPHEKDIEKNQAWLLGENIVFSINFETTFEHHLLPEHLLIVWDENTDICRNLSECA